MPHPDPPAGARAHLERAIVRRELRRARRAFWLAIAPHLTRCLLHRWQPAVPCCPCVMGGAAIAESSMAKVLCIAHLELHYDDELVSACFQCALERGLLPLLTPADTIESDAPATA